jgi:hypothetical protein
VLFSTALGNLENIRLSNLWASKLHLCVTESFAAIEDFRVMEIMLVDKPITREQVKAAAWPYYEEV